MRQIESQHEAGGAPLRGQGRAVVDLDRRLRRRAARQVDVDPRTGSVVRDAHLIDAGKLIRATEGDDAAGNTGEVDLIPDRVARGVETSDQIGVGARSGLAEAELVRRSRPS
jgi:hypothetical protein